MTKDEAPYIQTVLGAIPPEDAGTTLMHEHVFCDGSVSGYYFQEPDDPEFRHLAHEPVSIENLWWVRYNFKDNRDNFLLDDREAAVHEVTRYAEAGGNSLLELTVPGIGRDPEGLVEVAKTTGINIIMGTGYYVEASHPSKARIEERPVDDITDEMLSELRSGVGQSGVRAGAIGEIGCSWPLAENERKVLRAAGQAQGESGAMLNVHPGRHDDALAEIRDELAATGADLTKVVLSHMDRCGYELDTRRDVLDSGCVVEYDHFGLEGYYPARTALADGKLPDLPNDVGRIKETMELIELGYAGQIVLSHDIGMKIQMTRYGGWGYGHLLRNVVPLMRTYGLSDADIETMLVETPRRLLSIG